MASGPHNAISTRDGSAVRYKVYPGSKRKAECSKGYDVGRQRIDHKLPLSVSSDTTSLLVTVSHQNVKYIFDAFECHRSGVNACTDNHFLRCCLIAACAERTRRGKWRPDV